MSEGTLLLARQRKRILDSAWIATVLVLFGALLVPWYLRALDVDLPPLAWAFAIYLVIYVSASTLTDRLESIRAIGIAVVITQALSVVFLAIVWYLAGGVHNPMLLVAFVLQVLAGGLLMADWPRIAIALLSVVLVWGFALADSAQLRWFVHDLGVPVPPWMPHLPQRRDPFPGDALGPASIAVMLQMFAVFQIAAALLAGSLARLMTRLVERMAASAESLRELQSLFQAILRAAPHPGAIVYRDNAQVVHVSDSFLKKLLLTPEEIAGKTLFELIAFSHPERVQQLLTRGGGTAFFSVYRVGDEVRVANVVSYAVQHEGAAYAYVGVEDVTQQYHLTSAFDAVASPVLLINPAGRLLYANRAAEGLFGALYFGMEVEELLTVHGMPPGWWRTPTRMQAEPRVRFNEQPFLASAVPFRLAGELEQSTILTLRGIAHEEELLALATHDALTGLYNLRFLNSVLPQELERLEAGRTAAYAAVDLDYFKPINDQLGHAAGDAALIAFASHVRAELGPEDIFARVGGDEFAIVFPGVDAEVARTKLLRIYERLDKQPFVYDGSERKLSFSSGAVTVRPGDTVELLKERADRAVYAAKERGRGTCVVES